MVTDARGHIVPAGAEPPKRQAFLDLSDSIADVRSVADEAAAEAALVELDAADIEPTGTVWYFLSPGALYVYSGTEFVRLAAQTGVDNATKALNRLPYAMANGTTTYPETSPGSQRDRTITLPSGRFSSAPNVVMNGRTNEPSTRFIAARDVSKSSFVGTFQHRGSTRSGLNADWVAVQWRSSSALAEPLDVRADDADVRPDAVVTCPTDGCDNAGVPIPVAATWTDDDGTTHQVDAVECGVCGADITDTLRETS